MWQAGVELEGKRVDTLALKEGASVVGRSRNSELQVNAPDISRAHARIVVAGERVTVENLGRTGTRIEGRPLEGATVWQPGERVTMGSIAALILERVEEAAPVPDRASAVSAPASEEAAERTSDEPLDDGTSVRVDATCERTGAGPTAAGADDGIPGATRLSMPGSDGDGHTRAMQTRMVSPEELDALREMEHKKGRKRMVIALCVAAPILLAILFLRPRPLPPETEIDWPRDERDRPVETARPAPGGGMAEGGFDVLVPGSGPLQETSVEEGALWQTRIGRDRDVTLRLELKERNDKRFARMDRETLVREWIGEQDGDGRTWTFDRPYATLSFYGWDQGVPFTRVPYRRHDGREAWFGMAAIFRHGTRRYVLCAEIPVAERLRAERMLFMRYVKPSAAFERSHWEAPAAALETASAADMLGRARRDLARKAPLTWTRVEDLLKAVLAKSTAEDDSGAYSEALELLVELRENQARWYNSQVLARDDARAQGDRAWAERIAELAKAVFSDPEDRRYYQVRRW